MRSPAPAGAGVRGGGKPCSRRRARQDAAGCWRQIQGGSSSRWRGVCSAQRRRVFCSAGAAFSAARKSSGKKTAQGGNLSTFPPLRNPSFHRPKEGTSPPAARIYERSRLDGSADRSGRHECPLRLPPSLFGNTPRITTAKPVLLRHEAWVS